jgi:hypothetical protein
VRGNLLKIRIALFVAVGVLLTVASSFSQGVDRGVTQRNQIHFTAQPTVGAFFGYSKYVMDFNGYVDTAGTVLAHLKSALQFPMNVVMGGAVFSAGPSVTTHGDWSIEAGVFTNLNSPSKSMTDGDWETVPGFSGQFSYTESDAQMTSVLLTLEGYKSIWQQGSLGLDIMGGIRYQNIKQKINGYSGWQLDTIAANGVRQPVFGSGLVLTYSVTYTMPLVGLRAQMNAGRNTLLSASTAYLVVHAADDDNHLLRNKVAKASGSGSGVESKINMRFIFGSRMSRQMPFLVLSGDFVWLKAQASQTQIWYGPDIGGATAGTMISGIPHTILSTQLQLSARLGMAF